MSNNIKVNKHKTIFKLIFKIQIPQQIGSYFDVVLLVNTITKEVLGMGKIKQADPSIQDVLCNLSGNWTFKDTHAESGINIVIEGQSISRVNKHSASRKNAEITLSLEKDWRSGIANFKYLSGKEWLHGEHAQVELNSEQHVSELTSNNNFHQNNDIKTLH